MEVMDRLVPVFLPYDYYYDFYFIFGVKKAQEVLLKVVYMGTLRAKLRNSLISRERRCAL
uniref:Uncharacterized protein n=1 Tax=Anguilla anguilla TaxID=7936 RepID=A0A0E9WH63_ANGAN